MTEGADFWTATMKAYEPLQLPAPQLTEKLLQRPPFRFIHDLVAAINARFDAYTHVIPKQFVDFAAIESKEQKIEYLSILIAYVGKLLNTTIDVNAKHITAGKEPEKTNQFLQYLAAAVGYAQQDKANAVPVESGEGGAAKEEKKAKKKKEKKEKEAASAKKDSVASVAELDRGSLPSRDSLPRRKSNSSCGTERRASTINALDAAQKFNTKLENYSLGLNTSEARDVRKEGESIIQMWNELHTNPAETTPSQLPEDALETAIKRQMDAVKQVQQLIMENELVLTGLEQLVS